MSYRTTICTDNVSSLSGDLRITNAIVTGSPHIPDLDLHDKDGKYNLYLGKPSPSYAVYLTEGDLIRDGNIDDMEETGEYHIRNIYRGYHNTDRTKQYPTPYQLIVRDRWDDISFSSTIRIINIGPDIVKLHIDARSDIETQRIDMEDVTNPELLKFNNWSMTPIIGLEDNGGVSQKWNLGPGDGIVLGVYFMREAIYVESIKEMKADIHINEYCLGNRFKAYMEEYEFDN